MTSTENSTTNSHLHSPIIKLANVTYVNGKNQPIFIIISCKSLQVLSSSEYIWKQLCLQKWPELKHATSLEKDPFPIYKNCFSRKWKQEATSMSDLINIFGGCDWYSCPNGHLYAIGECRIPVMVAKCPECGELIGGKYHRMLNTNHRFGAVNGIYRPFMSKNLSPAKNVGFGDVMNTIHKQGNFVKTKNNNNIVEDDDDEFDDIYHDMYGQLSTITEETCHDMLKQFEKLDSTPEYLKCPLSLSVFIDPVVTPNGNVYEREQIEQWLQQNTCDPIDPNIELNVNELKSEPEVKQAADLWRQHVDNQNFIASNPFSNVYGNEQDVDDISTMESEDEERQ